MRDAPRKRFCRNCAYYSECLQNLGTDAVNEKTRECNWKPSRWKRKLNEWTRIRFSRLTELYKAEAERTSLHKRAVAAEGERVELRKQVAYLQPIAEGRLKEAAQVYLKEAGSEEKGTFDIALRSEIFPIMVEFLASAFKDMGGKNYVSMELQDDELGPLLLTIQRRNGKTPAQVAKEVQDEREQAESLLGQIRKDPALWQIPRVGGQDTYAGLPSFTRLIDEYSCRKGAAKGG
jgi:hypothetical protein